MRPLVLGTAGHIDHGKTALVGALTGRDTDRLPEEKERGISIELGYAPLELPGGRRLSVVDVPGHERFVRTMVAGATGIDLFLLVVDAREGVKPQTREHLAIVRLLGIARGVVAVTKRDLVDAERLAAAVAEAAALVPEAAAVVPVSALTGEGLPELRAALAGVAAATGASAPAHEALGAARLFVDRSFSLRGAGTVVTGTLWAGSIGESDALRLEPRGLDVRVRSVQVHDQAVERAAAGQRVAVALPGVERTLVARGDALVAPGAHPVSYRVDVLLQELEPVAHGARVQVHHGTTETLGRVVRAAGPGGEPYAQVRVARPLVAARGDRLVLRGETTLAGALVLDPAPARRLDPARLAVLHHGGAAEVLAAVVDAPVTRDALGRRGLLRPAELETALAAATAQGGPLVAAGAWVVARGWLERLRAQAHATLAAHAAASPLEPGLPAGELVGAAAGAAAGALLPLLELEQRGGRAYLPGAAAQLSPEAAAAAEQLLLDLEVAESGMVPAPDDALARHLEAAGQLVRVGDGQAVARATYDIGLRLLREECEREGRITLARFRDLVGVPRRVAQVLLECYDADGITRRLGDERVLRRAGRSTASG